MDWVEVGYSKKSFGVNGEIRLVIEDHYLEAALKASVFMIKIRGDAVPFFVEEFKVASDLLVKLEEVDSPEQAEQLKGKTLYMMGQEVEPVEEVASNLKFHYCLGYKLFDQEANFIGRVDEVLEFPQQEMASIQYQGKEVLIPLHDDLLIKSNSDEKVIHIQISHGLLDL